MIGLMALVISIYGALYALSYAVGLFPSVTNSQVVAVGLVLVFLSVVYASLERQYLHNIHLRHVVVEQTRPQMTTSVGEVTTAARTEVLMFCGTMSFITRDYEQFSQLKAGRCRVTALCKKPDSPEVRRHYELARSLGIEIRYYPSDELDPGIRGRIIDPNDFDNATAVLITKYWNDTDSIKYDAALFIGKRDTLELTLLTRLFRTLWAVSDIQ